MEITSAVFIKSAPSAKEFIQSNKLEFVLVGKSNVGKSSFINAIAKRKSLAKVGRTPGKTRMANFFLLNDQFYLVDMPGYGYAKVSGSEKNKFQSLLEDYIRMRRNDFCTLFFLDHRHEPTKNDLSQFSWLKESGITPVVILTKADKLSANQRYTMQKKIADALHIKCEELYCCSAVVPGYNKRLIALLEDIINEYD